MRCIYNMHAHNDLLLCSTTLHKQSLLHSSHTYCYHLPILFLLVPAICEPLTLVWLHVCLSCCCESVANRLCMRHTDNNHLPHPEFSARLANQLGRVRVQSLR